MRSFLTMLGIIIGIGSIIAIVSTIEGTNRALQDAMIGSQNNTVEVYMSQGGYSYEINDYQGAPDGVPVISEETKASILEINEVAGVTVYNQRTVDEGVYYLNNSLTDFKIYGVETNYFSTLGYVVKTGRLFMEDDYTLFRKVVILDVTSAENLFAGENPLGRTIEIRKEPFTVIGVVTDLDDSQSSVTDISSYYTYANAHQATGAMYIPKASWPIVFDYDEPENVVVRATSLESMSAAGQKTAKVLNSTITGSDSTSSDSGSSVTYMAEDLLEQVRNQQELANATNLQLMWVAGISLLVGGIGVMNIMLVSVTERTAEIGLKKAIGAKKSAILGQFLTEAAVLTSLGGLLGVGGGIGVSHIIHYFSGSSIPVAINVPWSAVAVLFSMVIGIVFGLLPATQAANLDPIEALRRE